MKLASGKILAAFVFIALFVALVSSGTVSADSHIVQTAVISEDHGYINLSDRGGQPGGGGIDNDGPPALQPAGMAATFSNFELNGIPFADWQACRSTMSVDDCLVTLIGDRDGDGTIGLRDLHPGAIGGDTLTFDITITNTSPVGGPVLTTFAFQSKFSESPALGSRIGDKLFSAQRFGEVISDAANPLIGVKKNGTANGLYGGKIKGICINSSDDYPSVLNLGVENETLECAGGRTFDLDTNRPVLQAADGDFVTPSNIELPKGLLPGESMTMRLVLDAGTDDGALERAYSPSCDLIADPVERDLCKAAVGPLVGTLANLGEPIAADSAADCLVLDVQSGDNVLEVVNFGDVKIIRDSSGNCVPSFEPFSKNQFLTVPRRNFAFTDILDTRDDYLPGELPTVLTDATGQFSFLDFDQLRPGEMNFFEILRGFGEFGETLDPSCLAGGSREGACGGSPYVPWGEFYGIDSETGNLVRQEVEGSYDPADYSGGGPTLTALIDTATALNFKTTDPFEPAGEPNAGTAIGASATAAFSDVVVISDDKTTIENEGGQAGGDKVRFTITIENTSPAGSNIYLTSFNFQTKQRGLTDINALDGTSILGRQDLRTGADGTLRLCEAGDPLDAECYDAALGIGRFPNVIGNSLLSSVFADPDPLDPLYGSPDQIVVGQLEAIKKNGTFQPLTKTDLSAANFVCIKSGPQSEDQDADETCSGIPTDSLGNPLGLAPGESQSVRLEMDYGDFRGLILRVVPGTLRDYVSPQDDPFGLLALRGDFDCRDQRRLPYCHPTLVGQDWFTSPTTLADVEFLTVHQPGDAATIMNFEHNFGLILAMAGFSPTAEFYQGDTQLQVAGAYLNLPGVDTDSLSVTINSPAEGSLVSGIVDIVANTVGTVTVDEVEFFVNGISIGVDIDGLDGWSMAWDTTAGGDGDYALTAVARGGGLEATSAVRTVTVANDLVVQIVEPPDGSTVTGVTNLVAETTGLNAATGVTFSYAPADDPGNSTEIGAASETSAGVWELSWDTSAIAAGDYLLTATATNGTETASDTIAIEIVSLSVTIVAPDDGAVLAGIVELQAEVVSAATVDGVEFFYRASAAAPPTSLGEATFDADRGLWVLNWDTRTVDDTPLTKPATQDELSVIATAGGGTASDLIEVRISNTLTARIFLPDNQESLVGYQDLEALVTGEFEVTSVRYDLYDISDANPDIFVPFGEASENGEPIPNPHYSVEGDDPFYPTGDPIYPIGDATFEGSQRWVFRGWDTVTIPDGTYALVATAFDSEGRKAAYTVETFIVNDIGIMISSPGDGDAVGPYVALEAFTGGLFPVTDVVFSVAGSDIVAAETSPGSGRWKATWDATATPDGPYTITATATNTATDQATDMVDVTLQTGTGDPLEAFFPFDWSNCIEFTCSFLDGSKGGPTSWSWSFGDGNTSTEQLPTHTYDTYGVYTVSLTVSDGTNSDSYSRAIPVGNIGIDDFNSQVVSGDETIAWTSALKDFGYVISDTIAVPVMWKTSSGNGVFADLQRAILFTPEEADGEVDEEFFPVEDGVLFTMRFTEVQFKGSTDVFKGKVNLGLNVDVDLNGDGVTDEVATLGTNVDVTNTDLVDTGDTLHVWVTEPDEGALVSGAVQIAATPLATVPVDEVEFFVNGESIGLGSPDPGSGRWLISWDTTGLAEGDYALSAVARGGGLIGTSSVVTVTVNTNGEPAPTVTLTADPESVASGESSTLSWSSTDATSCEASDGWSGSRDPSGGSESVSPSETTTYTLTCEGPGGTAEDSVTVTVEPPPSEGPTFSGSSTNQGRTWSAIVTVSDAAPNTLIEGIWNTGGEPDSCTTDGSGTCEIVLSGILKRIGSATWTDTATGQSVTISKP